MPGPVAYMVVAGQQPIGVALNVNPQDANNQSPVVPALSILAAGLVNLGLMRAPNVGTAGPPAPGTIAITIGAKPGPP